MVKSSIFLPILRTMSEALTPRRPKAPSIRPMVVFVGFSAASSASCGGACGAMTGSWGCGGGGGGGGSWTLAGASLGFSGTGGSALFFTSSSMACSFFDAFGWLSNPSPSFMLA